jgi:hypothetical protein
VAKIFTTVPGAVMEIGNYGPASNDRPAVVPEAVGKELEGREDLHVEADPTPRELKRLQNARKGSE